MTTSAKPFLVLFGVLVLVIVAAGVALAVSVYRAGMLEVDIQSTCSTGCSVTGLRVPGALVCLGMDFIPDDALSFEAREELETWGPAVRRAVKQLRRCPDFTLVEVDSGDEQVLIRKRGGKILVDVQSDCEDVQIVIPIDIVDSVLKRLENG